MGEFSSLIDINRLEEFLTLLLLEVDGKIESVIGAIENAAEVGD